MSINGVKAMQFQERFSKFRQGGEAGGSGDKGRPKQRTPRAFTLMELLVVMVIVAILASMSIPVGNAVMKRGRLMSAKHMALELRKAIGTYSAEYGRYPVASDNGSAATRDAEVTSDRTLMDVLLGSDDARGPGGLNPRGGSFISANRVSSDQNPRNGVRFTPNGGGTLYDPWGNLYRVIIDVDRNNRCEDPGGGGVVAKDVLVWSVGPNGKDDRGKGDDVITW
jgi:prepilin-type N-terminal cleavage/methylation domain-containing protein